MSGCSRNSFCGGEIHVLTMSCTYYCSVAGLKPNAIFAVKEWEPTEQELYKNIMRRNPEVVVNVAYCGNV